ncbi:MAG TPA: hypothetical protein PLD10_04030 [Rhodopila sp.]|nr:hypothetical protein [Rhodopila sp.]
MIWIGGFVLAVLLYIIGPDRFFDSVIDTLDSIGFSFREFVATLGAQAYGVIRAAAIALYVVFAVLAFLAAQRRHRGIGALVGVSVVFLLLVWRPYAEFPAPIGRWFAALVLVFAGAAVMTQRLLAPPPFRQDGPPPFPPGPGRPL